MYYLKRCSTVSSGYGHNVVMKEELYNVQYAFELKDTVPIRPRMSSAASAPTQRRLQME